MSGKVLIVDDDPLVLSSFERTLGRRFALDTAVGPERALEAASRRGPYAVVVSDMNMPGMSGADLLARIREHHPRTVGVILTGNTLARGLDEAVRSGVVSRVIEKPCDPGEVAEVLEELLTEGGARRSP